MLCPFGGCVGRRCSLFDSLLRCRLVLWRSIFLGLGLVSRWLFLSSLFLFWLLCCWEGEDVFNCFGGFGSGTKLINRF